MPDPQWLAGQLRRPSGDDAAEVGRNMNASNGPLNLRCIAQLACTAGDRVLEIGPGNGGFVRPLLEAAPALDYTGVDWSDAMVAEARADNTDLVAAGRVRFLQGSSAALPFADAAFDRVLAVHTLYFWEPPESHLAEIARVLRPGGSLCIAFGDAGFMRDLPFTAHGFRLYTLERARETIEAADLRVLDAVAHRESGQSNAGATVDKHVHIVCCDRP
ncbi:class I SAM-dependent methyltransferase [Algiphilus sp.]|uniref:class I SAM-dependent methyltransferase n=1 Tax=Algiphilus sp. TaxID=1872431 RepID=UPI0025BE0E1D|nr:class I SAM-dependent methyltransferase [Algiphilus sp.]MCK5771097.1 class I SAM-dependent methyltransferase [Algiphilus sp.]